MRIGAIFCDCAGQISDLIDFEELKSLIPKEIDWLERFELACSEETEKEIINLLSSRRPQGLIILACSPHNKGSVFHEIAKKAGINPYMVNFVNLREQVSWVTKNKKQATLKALALLNTQLKRLKLQSPLFDIEIPVSENIIVIGGGIAGLTAAKTLSKAGKKVYLIEKSHVLGGKVAKYEKLFPDLSCAPCFLHPVVEEVLQSNVHLRLNSELIDLKGYYGNIYAEILRKPTFVEINKCIGCSACEEVCPEGAIKVEKLGFPQVAKIEPDKCLYFKGKECNLCIKECPVEGAINFDDRETREKLNASLVLWATGFRIFDCREIPNLGYGKFKDVYNSLEFEEILNSEGPTAGEILTETGEYPQTVAIIHCVGSLDEKYNPYCSKICCQYALKFNRILRQLIPELKIIHFVKEIVLPGTKAYELYLKTKKDPMVEIVRYENIESISVIKQESQLYLKKDSKEYPSDIIVLCPAIVFGETFPEENTGIILTGSVKEAMTVEEAITDSLSVCGKILSELHEGKILRAPTIAKIDYNICSRCGICISQCPYKAIEIDIDKHKAIEIDIDKPKIIETLCEGCGICVASCPSKAMELEGFTFEQILAEIEGILDV
ncbi:4Fe-4S dicluster domain-containing protein [Thermodesulfovibrio hydrogeniphilus]